MQTIKMDGVTMDLISEIRTAIGEGIERGLQLRTNDTQIRIPAKDAAASSSVLVRAGSDATREAEKLNRSLDCFPDVRGARLLSRVRESRGWLLFDLSKELYDLAAEAAPLPAGPPCGESYCYYRMNMLARYPSRGCPDDESVQRALLLCWTAYAGLYKSGRGQAEQALLAMGRKLPASERQSLLRACGDIGRTALRLLYSE